MRRERIRVYTEASGPLYFGRIDPRGRRAALHRPPRRRGRRTTRSCVSQLARARRRAVLRRHRARAPRVDAAPAARHRGPRASSASSTRRCAPAGEDHLTEAIVEDITRQRVGEMRQIISTITPEQYELIREDPTPRARHPGRPRDGQDGGRAAPRRVAAVREPVARARGRAGRRPEPDVHPLHRAGAAGARRAERRAARDRRADLAPAPRDRRGPRARDAQGQRADGGRCSSGCCGAGVAPPAEDDRRAPRPRARSSSPRRRCASCRTPRASARARTRRRACASASALADRIAGAAGRQTERGSRRSRYGDVVSAVRKTKEYQRLTNKAWPRETPEGLFGDALQEPQAPDGAGRTTCCPTTEIGAAAVGRPAVRAPDMTPTDVALLDEARWLIDPEMRTFGHVVVDEAQNLTPMELRMVVRRARRQSLTILGDIAQRTPRRGVSSWEPCSARPASTRFDDPRARAAATACPTTSCRLAAADRCRRRAGPARRARGAVAAGRRARGRRRRGRRSRRRARATAARGRGRQRRRRRARRSGSTRCGPRSRASTTPTPRTRRSAPASTCSTCTWSRASSSTRSSSSSRPRSSRERPDGGRGGLYTALTRSTRALAIVHAAPLPAALQQGDHALAA